MDQCFLFTRHLDENGCYCLKLGEDGSLLSPPAYCDFAQIKSLQQQSKTLLVETTEHATLLALELPWIAERKARVAIPFALEDKLAQPVDTLHFAFDKAGYRNNHYLVAVIDKQRMEQLIATLSAQEIAFDALTLDWFALEPGEFIVSEHTLLVNAEDFNGALSGELALVYLQKHTENPLLLFADSQIGETQTVKSTEYSYTWIAQRLKQTSPLNLCQGEFQQENPDQWVSKGYPLVAGLFGLWLLSLLAVNAWTWHSLSKKIAVTDQQIAVIYHRFFPNAKQVISPKFRISQLLGTNSDKNQSRFWFLSNQLAQAIKTSNITVEEMRFQNKTLSATLISDDFAQMEQIELTLKQMQLHVKQLQASTRGEKVIATLELT